MTPDALWQAVDQHLSWARQSSQSGGAAWQQVLQRYGVPASEHRAELGAVVRAIVQWGLGELERLPQADPQASWQVRARLMAAEQAELTQYDARTPSAGLGGIFANAATTGDKAREQYAHMERAAHLVCPTCGNAQDDHRRGRCPFCGYDFSASG